jgi:hypothetical protein
MIGENRVKRFMETVEAVTDNLEKPDPLAEKQEQIEIDEDLKAADRREVEKSDETMAPAALTGSEAPSAATSKAAIPLSELFMKGAEFLTTLGQAIAKDDASPHEVIEKQVQAMIGKDEATGKTYLKVPLPEPEMVQNIFSAVGTLLARVFAKK